MKLPKISNKSVSNKGDQSWHNLRDSNIHSSRIRTFASIYRRIRPFLKWAFIGLSSITVFFYLKVFVFNDIKSEQLMNVKNGGSYVKRVLFYTNGVLDEAWLSDVIQINQNMQLMDIKIFELKHLLESYDQILEAKVSRIFPDTLRIDLEEEIPMFKLNVQDGNEADFHRFVGRSGLIYSCIGYPDNYLEKLPYLIPYCHLNRKYFPINGLDYVVQLINLLEKEGLSERIGLQSISLKNFSGDSDFPGEVIELKSDLIPRILFGAYTDYNEQIVRLNFILSFIDGGGYPEVNRIDLSMRGAVPVEVEELENFLF